MKETYNGFEIAYDEKKETWYAHVRLEGDQGNSSENRVERSSLKALKELLDKVKRAKFERMNVFVRTSNYRYGGGQDKEYLPYYTEAVVTSIAPNGNAYVVSKGEKHAAKHSLTWGSNEIILDTPENRKLIAEFEAAAKAEWEAEVKQSKLREKFKYIDGKKVYQAVYGKELN